MMSRPCSPNSSSGFSVVELLVTLTIIVWVGMAALSMAMSGRDLFEVDQARVRLTQNLRASMEYLVGELRQAGGRLGSDFPAIVVLDGTSGAPDTLKVRHNLEDSVLRLCQDIFTGDTDVQVYMAQTSTPPPGCAVDADDDSDGWPNNLQAWKTFRNSQPVRAYIYNPVSGLGEFFDYIGEDNSSYYLQADSIVWQNDYPVTDEPRIYLLEEQRFQLSDGMLQLTLNDDSNTTVNIADALEGFQLIAHFQDNSQQTSMGFSDIWADLRAIEVRLDGRVQVRGGNYIDRSWTSEIMPRGVLSR